MINVGTFLFPKPGTNFRRAVLGLNVSTIRAEMTPGERNIGHLYLDTLGRPTIGIGNLLDPGLTKFKTLPLWNATQNRKPTTTEIEAEYTRVMALPFGNKYPAHTFKAKKGTDSITITARQGEELFEKRIRTEFAPQLRAWLPDFDSMVAHGQLLLLDLIYQQGVSSVFGPIDPIDGKRKGGTPNSPGVDKAIVGDWVNAAADLPRKSSGRDKHRAGWAKEAEKEQQISDANIDQALGF